MYQEQQTGESLAQFLTELRQFVDNYDGPPITLITTGGGVLLNLIPLVPGASRVFHCAEIPYAESASNRITGMLESGGPVPRSVSASMAMLYGHTAAKWLKKEELDGIIVVVTAALVTNRYRRGDEHAYIGINGVIHHAVFHKHSEEEYAAIVAKPGGLDEERLRQDLFLSRHVLKTLLGGENESHGFKLIEEVALEAV